MFKKTSNITKAIALGITIATGLIVANKIKKSNIIIIDPETGEPQLQEEPK